MRRRSAARPRFVFVFGMSQPLHVVLRIAILSCFVHFRIASFVFSGLKAHVAPRCHQPRVGTILQSKLASGYTSGKPSTLTPVVDSDRVSDCIACSDSMAGGASVANGAPNA